MNPLTRFNVRHQLLLVIVMLLAPLFLMNVYAYRQAERILTDQVTGAYVELIKQNHILIEGEIDTINKIDTTIIQHPLTQQFASVPSVSIQDRVKAYDMLNKLLSSYSTGAGGGDAIQYSFVVPDPGNEYFFAPDYRTVGRGVFFVAEEEQPAWYEEATERRGKGFLKVIDGFGANSRPTLAFIRSVNNIEGGTKPIGVLIATNMNKKLAESMQSVVLPQGSIYLTDLDNRSFVDTDLPLGSELKSSPDAENIHVEDNVRNFIRDGFIFVEHHSHTGMQKLIYQISIDSLIRQQNALKSTILTVSVVYLILCCMVLVYFFRSLIRPLLHVVRFIKAYEPGKAMPALTSAGRKDEVGVLLDSVKEMSERLDGLIHDRYEMEIKHKETQLQILYEQINPHLLYNTLESIYWKSSLSGDKSSAEMIKDLSNLMKIGLSSGRELILLEEELEHARSYIHLQQKRYDYEFQVQWLIEPDTLQTHIPKISVQPLVENAILHGVRNMGVDGTIRILTWKSGHTVHVRIADNGFKAVDVGAINRLLRDNHDADAVNEGYGLRNVDRRIRMHFGEQYGLHFERGAGNIGTVVTIVLPG